jgi:C1A family cysteine protease
MTAPAHRGRRTPLRIARLLVPALLPLASACAAFGRAPAERLGAPSPYPFEREAAAAALPARVDMSPYFPVPGDQGRQNSCVAWAAAYVRAYEERARQGLFAEADSAPLFSPSFVYNQINRGRDVGARIPEALRLVAKDGIAPLWAMPYVEGDFLSRPDGGTRALARRFRSHGWRRLNPRDVDEVRASLGAGFPVIVAARVDSAFSRIAPGQVWSDTVPQGRRGHAMVLVGYDDDRGAFKVINSWGQRWAEGGFGWISYGLMPVVAREGYVDKRAPRNTVAAARIARAAGTIAEPAGPGR